MTYIIDLFCLARYLYIIKQTKKLEIMTTITLTPEKKERIKNEMRHTADLLSKELSVSEDLRYQDKVDSYVKHIIKLDSYLTQGFIAIQ